MSKPNHQEWSVKHQGYEIKVTSWFKWSGKLGGELLIDGHLLDKIEIDQVDDDNFDSVVELFNPEKPILKALEVSEQIQISKCSTEEHSREKYRLCAMEKTYIKIA